MVFLSFKIVQFVLVSFSILKTLSYLYFCITFHKEGHQNQAQVQPRRAGTCPCKHSGVRPNNHSHTHAVAHAFTSPHILMSQRQCRICRGHTVSHICPSLLSSVRWATRAPPAHQASERTLSLHPSQAPALLTGDAFTSGKKGGRAVEGTSFQICPSHPQHSQYHTPAPPKTLPLALPLHTWNWTTHVPCLCPALLHAPPPQPESAKTHRASGISLETSSLPKGAWH